MSAKRSKLSRKLYRLAKIESDRMLNSSQLNKESTSSTSSAMQNETNKNADICHTNSESVVVDLASSASDTEIDFSVVSGASSDSEYEVHNNLDLSEEHHSAENICNDNITLKCQLSNWALTYHIPQNAVTSLLKILKPLDTSLPSDARTLLNTPRKITGIKTVNPGHYYHFGFTACLNNLLSKQRGITDIKLCVNIDGLPIWKSSGSGFYPILCSLFGYKETVDMIGIYYGIEKPKEANELLEDFVREAVLLTNNGFTYKNTVYRVTIYAVVCDAPAKSYILYLKGHSGYSSCTKCHIRGEYIKDRVCFPNTHGIKLRTNEDFKMKTDQDHHNGTSLLETIPNFDMVKNIPLDYMHLVCLGVMRKLLLLWTSGKPPNKLSYRQIEEISQNLINLQISIPCEFARKPRSLLELKRWKATELRQFLLYTGCVVLKSILNPKMYLNFVCLHVAIRILCSENLYPEIGEYANSLLLFFIETFANLYGPENVTHNVHNLLHIFSDVQNYGVLDKFSAFAFENYLQSLKLSLRKTSFVLEQVIKRKLEIDNLAKPSGVNETFEKIPLVDVEHNNGPLLDNKCVGSQFNKLILRDCVFKLNESDNCCLLKDNNIVNIFNVIKNDDGVFIVAKKFLYKNDFYVQPCKSSDIGIFIVEEFGPLEMWNANEICVKYVKLKHCIDKYVVLPLLHKEKLEN